MRRFWSKKPDLLSQLLPTLQAYGYEVQQGKTREWWLSKDNQVWARLSSSSGWCLEIILEDKDTPQVNTLLLLTSVFRETCGFPISFSATSRLWERPITERRAASAAQTP